MKEQEEEKIGTFPSAKSSMIKIDGRPEPWPGAIQIWLLRSTSQKSGVGGAPVPFLPSSNFPVQAVVSGLMQLNAQTGSDAAAFRNTVKARGGRAGEGSPG